MESSSGKTLIKIAITGPESTGKSWLAKHLAEYYDTQWTPEYAREYLAKNGPDYQQEDLLKIAEGQLLSEERLMPLARKYLFCDTELLVVKIWSEYAYNQCHEWVLAQLELPRYGLYLLCDIDLPWEADPLREHPHLRQYFFDLYQQELINRKLPFVMIRGRGEERLQGAINAINERFNSDI